MYKKNDFFGGNYNKKRGGTMEVTGTLKMEQRPVVSASENKKLRNAGMFPGNIYGRGVISVPIAVRKDELRRCLVRYARSAVIKLDMDGGKAYTVVIKEVQNEPINGGYLHVDFQQISLKEEMQTGDNIYAKDIKLPEGVALEIDSELLALSVSEPKIRDLEQEEERDKRRKESRSSTTLLPNSIVAFHSVTWNHNCERQVLSCPFLLFFRNSFIRGHQRIHRRNR